jgi:hypothetical protein
MPHALLLAESPFLWFYRPIFFCRPPHGFRVSQYEAGCRQDSGGRNIVVTIPDEFHTLVNLHPTLPGIA